MTEQIILNGVNVDKVYTELLETRDKIRQEAYQFMSENIDVAQQLTEQLSKTTDIELIKEIANEAYLTLYNVQKVSEVSGVEYNLPYSSHNSLLSSYKNKLFQDLQEIEDLKEIFDEMEEQTSRWQASYC